VAQANRLLPIAHERHEQSAAICVESQAALKIINRELRRLQQAAMYASDAVVVVTRQEAVAERTTRQTALSFTREILDKKAKSVVAAEETRKEYLAIKAAHEASIPVFERAVEELAVCTGLAMSNKATADTRLVEAKHELAARIDTAEALAVQARTTAVAMIEPFGSLLIAVTAESASEGENRAKVIQGQRLMERDMYAEAVVAFTEALETDPPPQTADTASILELRATCYNALSCFEDAKADVAQSIELVHLADTQAGGFADVVLNIVRSDDDSQPTGGGNARGNELDPCLEAYAAVACANLFEGICRTGSDATAPTPDKCERWHTHSYAHNFINWRIKICRSRQATLAGVASRALDWGPILSASKLNL
jgi:tetratricopeptide (TPR) repeat protein